MIMWDKTAIFLLETLFENGGPQEFNRVTGLHVEWVIWTTMLGFSCSGSYEKWIDLLTLYNNNNTDSCLLFARVHEVVLVFPFWPCRKYVF